MRVIITGPTGAIGIALIQECIKNNVEVLAICRKNSKRRKNIPRSPLVDILELNLDEYHLYEPQNIQKCDVFFHFAWNATIGNGRNDMMLQNENVRYALDAVLLAKKLGCNTFIGAGSQAEYGRSNEKLTSKTPTFPENGYGIAKLCAGQMTRIMCQQQNMRHVWMRILSIYGPHDGEMTMVSSTIKKLLNGEVPQFTKGEQMWDYLYSKDAARAMLLLAEKGKNGKIYCIGSGQKRPLAEYIQDIRDAIDPALNLDLGAIEYSSNQVMYLCADIDELTKDTGFVPTTKFKDGIEETIMWMKNKK